MCKYYPSFPFRSRYYVSAAFLLSVTSITSYLVLSCVAIDHGTWLTERPTFTLCHGTRDYFAATHVHQRDTQPWKASRKARGSSETLRMRNLQVCRLLNGSYYLACCGSLPLRYWDVSDQGLRLYFYILTTMNVTDSVQLVWETHLFSFLQYHVRSPYGRMPIDLT
jgi:hypothetical protein